MNNLSPRPSLGLIHTMPMGRIARGAANMNRPRPSSERDQVGLES